MAVLIVPNAAQMRLIWSFSGQLYALNVMGVVNAGALAITQAMTNTIGTAVKAALASTSFNGQLHESVALANVGLRDAIVAVAGQLIWPPRGLETCLEVVEVGLRDVDPEGGDRRVGGLCVHGSCSFSSVRTERTVPFH